ncbi:MAG: hypothetical protein GY870_14435 [archaeon]|nr:hypothetical protein [archaeon]
MAQLFLLSAIEFCVVGFLIIISWNLYKKYRKKRLKGGLYLLLTELGLVFFTLFTAIINFFLDTNNVNYATLEYISLIFLPFPHYFLFKFTDNLFLLEEERKKRAEIFFIFNFLSAIGTGLFFLLDMLIITIFMISVFFGCTSIVFLNLIIRCYYAIKKIESEEDLIWKKRFEYIRAWGVCFFLMYSSFGIDQVFAFGGSSNFRLLGWIFCIVGTIYAYIGFVMPDYFKRRYSKI